MFKIQFKRGILIYVHDSVRREILIYVQDSVQREFKIRAKESCTVEELHDIKFDFSCLPGRRLAGFNPLILRFVFANYIIIWVRNRTVPFYLLRENRGHKLSIDNLSDI